MQIAGTNVRFAGPRDRDRDNKNRRKHSSDENPHLTVPERPRGRTDSQDSHQNTSPSRSGSQNPSSQPSSQHTSRSGSHVSHRGGETVLERMLENAKRELSRFSPSLIETDSRARRQFQLELVDLEQKVATNKTNRWFDTKKGTVRTRSATPPADRKKARQLKKSSLAVEATAQMHAFWTGLVNQLEESLTTLRTTKNEYKDKDNAISAPRANYRTIIESSDPDFPVGDPYVKASDPDVKYY